MVARMKLAVCATTKLAPAACKLSHLKETYLRRTSLAVCEGHWHICTQPPPNAKASRPIKFLLHSQV